MRYLEMPEFGHDVGNHSMQAVYGVLKEAEHRSTFYIPYWKIPLARALVPRQRTFGKDLCVINDCLDELISMAKQTRSEGDEEALQSRDYTQVDSGPIRCVQATSFQGPH